MDQELPKPVSGASRRALMVVLIVGLGVIGGVPGCGKGAKSSTTGDNNEQKTAKGAKSPSAGGNNEQKAAAGVKDISEDDLRGIFNGMTGEDFKKVIDKLGRPTLTGRQTPTPRYSCKHMAAWKKKDGTYLLLHWLESTEPNGSKQIVNFRTWDNQSLRQVEDLKLLLK